MFFFNVFTEEKYTVCHSQGNDPVQSFKKIGVTKHCLSSFHFQNQESRDVSQKEILPWGPFLKVTEIDIFCNYIPR